MRRILAVAAVAGAMAAGIAVTAAPDAPATSEAYGYCYRVQPSGACTFSPWRVNKAWPLPAAGTLVRR